MIPPVWVRYWYGVIPLPPLHGAALNVDRHRPSAERAGEYGITVGTGGDYIAGGDDIDARVLRVRHNAVGVPPLHANAAGMGDVGFAIIGPNRDAFRTGTLGYDGARVCDIGLTRPLGEDLDASLLLGEQIYRATVADRHSTRTFGVSPDRAGAAASDGDTAAVVDCNRARARRGCMDAVGFNAKG